jgi:hypothetical protein
MGFALASLALGSLYAATIARLWHAWNVDSYAGHVMLVPAFSLVLLWTDRDRLRGRETGRDARGFALLFAGLAREPQALAAGLPAGKAKDADLAGGGGRMGGSDAARPDLSLVTGGLQNVIQANSRNPYLHEDLACTASIVRRPRERLNCGAAKLR